MSENKKAWYVVRAIGGKEHKVKEYLEAEIRHNHLEDYISQVLIPTEKVYTIRNGKKISKEKVSYPGYVLVEAAFVGQIPIIIRNTPNVLGFLVGQVMKASKGKANPQIINKLILEELNKYYSYQLFDTKISRSVTLSEAPSFGEPIKYYAKYSHILFIYAS